ncbi:MAG: sensor domain-containing diguanylate cyclase [Clostridia bacterium]
MKRRTLILINVIVCFIIISGFAFVTILNNNNMGEIIENDIENITKLSSSTIYGEIDNSLTKPIFVGQTMANDTFLKTWLKNENTTLENNADIINYLTSYQKKYNYDSVFLVSSKTNVYYHFDGINKVISEKDSHDIWYYDFIKSGKDYDLDVDTDEANNGNLTVFINCRIKAEDGSVLGVVGVGVKMNHLQQLLLKYETEYNLKASLINKSGVVQIDSDAKKIESTNFFTAEESKEKNRIISNTDSMEMFWYPSVESQNCITSQYIKNLDWYLVVQKNTMPIKDYLTSQFNRDLIFIIGIIAIVILLSTFIISRYNKLLISTAATDEVTDLPNAKMFHEMFRRNYKRNACKTGVLFIFDIDGFKEINDKNGHLFGNTVLFKIATILKEYIGNKGLIARFGGDEFFGVIYGNKENATKTLEELFEVITNNDSLKELTNITISLGATVLTPGVKLDTLVKEADTAMYCAKSKGKNQMQFYE